MCSSGGAVICDFHDFHVILVFLGALEFSSSTIGNFYNIYNSQSYVLHTNVNHFIRRLET